MTRERNTSYRDVRLQRREIIARLRARRLTVRQITEALALPPFNIVNPKTGKPYSFNQVQYDLQKIRAMWRKSIEQSAKNSCAAILHELNEIKRRAWELDNLQIVLQACKQEADLRGLLGVHRIEITGKKGGPVIEEKLVIYIPDNKRDKTPDQDKNPVEQGNIDVTDGQGNPTETETAADGQGNTTATDAGEVFIQRS